MFLGGFFFLVGLFSIAGAVLEWPFFMNNRRARLVAKVLGRGGTRIFYIVLGVAMATIGALSLTGTLDLGE